MATKDQIDQDALAAEWGLALESDNGAAQTGGDATAGASADDAAAQWAAMADDPGGLQSAKGGAERILNQEEIDSLRAELQQGTIYKFPYSYRGGLEADAGFLLMGEDGHIFFCVGSPTKVDFVGLAQVAVIEEESNEEEMDLMDFDMI